MNADELNELEGLIASKREEREEHNRQAQAAKAKARALSVEIRTLEGQLPPPTKRKGIRMQVGAASVRSERG